MQTYLGKNGTSQRYVHCTQCELEEGQSKIAKMKQIGEKKKPKRKFNRASEVHMIDNVTGCYKKGGSKGVHAMFIKAGST